MRYEYEKQLREHQIKQQLLVNQKERKAMIYLVVAGVMLLLFIIAILWIRNQRIKISQVELSRKGLELERRNLALEKDNLSLLNDKLGIELEYRKKELATQVMYLLQKNELIAKTIKEIQQINQAGNDDKATALHSILRALKSNLDTGAWEEFEVRFQQVHRDFYDKLQNLYPDLSPNEIKLSAFLRLNMTTKDISAITFHTPKSIQVARTRLRKKLGIEREDNLVTYLQQL
jgi:DNA-binding CsgD family transcriptional regulator